MDGFASGSAQHPATGRIQQLDQALRHVNQAIVRTRAPGLLLGRVCSILVERGGLSRAGIAWLDPAQARIVPMAHAGGEDRHDFAAHAELPLEIRGEVRGTLDVCADEPGFFGARELELLSEVAVDVSFALDNLALVAERERIEAIAERERRFATTIIESMPGIFYFYDQSGHFLRWNKNFARVSGHADEAIARMHPLDFFPAEARPLVAERIAEVFARGESHAEAPFLAADGSLTPYYFTGQRVVFDGEPCLVGVGVDLSERRRAEEALGRSEERYRTTLGHMLEGCQILDFDWRYLYMNAAAAVQNRRPNAELLGKRMPDMWPGIEATPVFAMFATCMTERRALHQEAEFTFPDGVTGWFDVRVQPVPEGIFVLSIDISERKQAELELRELNESLERKVAERTRDLEIARGQAETADRLKSAFLATMSHELRTPLNSIIGFTGILVQGLAGPLNPEQAKQLGVVQSSARHLLELINDVLDISKIEAGQVEVKLTRFDLQAAIDRAVASIRPQAERKQLELRVERPDALVELRSDRRRVDQILLNLLNNAVKFTDRGRITLTADVVDDAARGAARRLARIRVADTGIGIAPEDMARLFQPFRQLDHGQDRQREGSGLGLAICSRLTQLLGGTISAESQPGQGSVFTVSLPLEAP
jgi:PAS domain S-box-containing protein